MHFFTWCNCLTHDKIARGFLKGVGVEEGYKFQTSQKLIQGVKVGMLGRQNERNSSYVRLAQTSIFDLCFMSVSLTKWNCYSLIYSSLSSSIVKKLGKMNSCSFIYKLGSKFNWTLILVGIERQRHPFDLRWEFVHLKIVLRKCPSVQSQSLDVFVRNYFLQLRTMDESRGAHRWNMEVKRK